MADDASVAEEVARLYGLAPEAFVAERNATAKAWKKAARSEDAATLAALRKPSVVEDAVNRAARRSPAVVDRWFRALHDAGDAQSATIGGAKPEALRSALAELRAATAALVDAAAEAIGDTTKRTAIEALVRSTSVAGAEQVRSGVVGSAVVVDDELFAGAPEPPPRAERQGSAPHAAQRARNTHAVAVEAVADEEPVLAQPQPDAAALERRRRLEADRGELEHRLVGSERDVETARVARAAARAKLDSSERELAAAEQAHSVVRSELAAVIDQLGERP